MQDSCALHEALTCVFFWRPCKAGICDACVRAAAQVSFDAAEDIRRVAREYLPVLERIAPYLPDTDFVVNTLDTPRVRYRGKVLCRVLVVHPRLGACRWRGSAGRATWFAVILACARILTCPTH